MVSELKFYLGARELNSTDRPLSVTAIDKNNKIVYSKNLTSGAVFYWSTENIDQNVSKLILSTISPELYIEEMALTDSSNNPIEPTGYVHSDDSALFDEQSLVPDRSSYRNSTYFDEIYHARTAYEFLHHLSVYEWTHPPLGKVFISIGIAISGMCPFGWRIAGTIFGILMIPLIYVFAKRLLGKSFLAVITCLLFTFDFMHFAQTRIATIDVYVTFFIIMMYFFMYKYATMSFFDTPLRKTFVPLAFCGISMGLGIASKWTGIYAGAGLAVIFFLIMAMRYREYSYAKREPKGETNGIKHSYVIENYASHTAKTIGWCLIFFVLVPALIYGLSYIPYLMTDGAQGIKTIFDNQESMLTYHGSTVLGSTHPFSSRWYEWIIMKRPIWYYSGSLDNGLKEGISSFGNPLVWWIGIPAFCWMVVTAVTNKDKTAIFLCIAYIAELLPWVGVERLTFIYHYFPCVPFITLMIGYSIKTIYDEARIKHRKAITIGVCVYAAAVIGMFILFYPVLSGKPCSYEFAEHFLKWFDTWVLL